LGLSVTPTGVVTAPVSGTITTPTSAEIKIEEKTETEVKELERVLEATTSAEETPAHEADSAGVEVAKVKNDEEIAEETKG